MPYNELKKIMNREGITVFLMATSHLIDIGYRNAIEITDKDIEELEGNGLMTQRFVQNLVKVTREIAQTVSIVELIQFFEVEKLYDIKGFKTKER